MLGERDLDHRRGSLLVRNGKGGRRREIGMDAWGWEQLRPWLAARVELPVGPLFCVIDGPTRGRPWSSANVRVEFPPARRRRRDPAPLRSAPAPPRPRRRTRARRRAAQRHPTPARPLEPRHHIDLPARHRHRRDHRDRPRQAPTDDVRHHRTATLNDLQPNSGSAPQTLPLGRSTRPPLRRPMRASRRLIRAFPSRPVVVPRCATNVEGGWM